MKYRYLILACLNVLIAIFSIGSIKYPARLGEKNGTVRVDEYELDKLTDWRWEEKPEPNISIGAARLIAQKWLNDALSKPELKFIRPWVTNHYELRDITFLPLAGRDWIYKVSFEETSQDPIVHTGGESLVVDVYVDLNGNVLEPDFDN